jgi:hypothetical protein
VKIRPLEAELLHADRQTDRQTDMTKLLVAFLNFKNTLNKTKVDKYLGVE